MWLTPYRWSTSKFLPADSGLRKGLDRWLCFLPMYHAMARAVFIIVSAPSTHTSIYHATVSLYKDARLRSGICHHMAGPRSACLPTGRDFSCPACSIFWTVPLPFARLLVPPRLTIQACGPYPQVRFLRWEVGSRPKIQALWGFFFSAKHRANARQKLGFDEVAGVFFWGKGICGWVGFHGCVQDRGFSKMWRKMEWLFFLFSFFFLWGSVCFE